MERYLGDRTAEEYRTHMDTIKAIVDSWQRGDIGVASKRAQIAAENQRFYNTGQLNGTGLAITSEPRLTDEVAHLIADSNGIPLEAARAALHARRSANMRAANAGSIEEAVAEMTQGKHGYDMIMATAR